MNRFFAKGISISEEVFLRTGSIEEAQKVLDRTCSMCKSNIPCSICPVDGKRDEYEHPRKVVVHEIVVSKDMVFKPEEVIHIRRPRKIPKPVVIERHPLRPSFIKFKRK